MTARNQEFNKPGDDPLSFTHNERLLHKAARMGLARLMSAGITVQYEDVLGEMHLAYVKSLKGFKPEFGVMFSTYLTRACMNHLNNYCSKLMEERFTIGLFSVEGMLESEEGEGSSLSQYDVVASEELGPEEALSQKEEALHNMAQLSPLTQKVVRVLLNPPEELLDEIAAQLAHAEKAKELDCARYRANQGLTIATVGRVCGLTDREMKTVRGELKSKFGLRFNGGW